MCRIISENNFNEIKLQKLGNYKSQFIALKKFFFFWVGNYFFKCKLIFVLIMFHIGIYLMIVINETEFMNVYVEENKIF